MAANVSLRQSAIRFMLEALYFSGAHHLFGSRCGGAGLILTLHHVRPALADAFQPNRALEVTPEFLESVVVALRQQELDFIDLDEVPNRLRSPGSRRFACVTFDDGYRDVMEWAYPVLKRHGVPFTIFVTSDFADGRGHLWWRTLENAIALNEHVEIEINGAARSVPCQTTAEKYAAFHAIGGELSALRSEPKLRCALNRLADRMGFDTQAQCAAACLGWTELAELAADPLVTIGAHTVTHPKLGTLDAAAARREMEASADGIEAALGARPAHFAYPFGDALAAGPREFALAAELGFRTAVTTRPGVVSDQSGIGLMSLPRISLNGEFQRLRYLRVLASGVPSATWNGLRQLKGVRSAA